MAPFFSLPAKSLTCCVTWDRLLSFSELHSLLVPEAGVRLYHLLDSSSSTNLPPACRPSLPFPSSHSSLSSPPHWVCPISQQQEDKAAEAGELDSRFGTWRTHFTALSLLILSDYTGRMRERPVLVRIKLQPSTGNVGVSGIVRAGTLSSCLPLCPIFSTPLKTGLLSRALVQPRAHIRAASAPSHLGDLFSPVRS